MKELFEIGDFVKFRKKDGKYGFGYIIERSMKYPGSTIGVTYYIKTPEKNIMTLNGKRYITKNVRYHSSSKNNIICFKINLTKKLTKEMLTDFYRPFGGLITYQNCGDTKNEYINRFS